MRPGLIPVVLALGIVLPACGSDTETSPAASTSTTVAPQTDTPPPTTSVSSTTTEAPQTTDSITTEAPVPTSAIPDGIPIVERAIADLAERLDVDPDAIEVVSVEEVTWADGSLGCPEPGRSYTQALVNGTLIRLAADSTEYEYHAGRGGDPFYCPADRSTRPTGGVDPNY